MSYYFYISKARLNELLSETNYDGRFDKVSVKRAKKFGKKKNLKGKMQLPIVGVGASLSYGNENVLQFNSEQNNNYIKKLHYLLGVNKSLNDCSYLNQEVKELQSNFKYKGIFEISSPITKTTRNSIIRICSQINGCDIKIICDCSAINFSEYIESQDEEKQNIIHSGNKSFFLKQIPLNVDGLFERLAYNQAKKEIFARALYLVLSNDTVTL